jgi:predicted dehydrogenase
MQQGAFTTVDAIAHVTTKARRVAATDGNAKAYGSYDALVADPKSTLSTIHCRTTARRVTTRAAEARAST